MNTNDLKQNQNNLEAFEDVSIPESLEALTIDDSSETNSLVEMEIKEPKKDIINHLKQSNGDFSYFSAADKERSDKIREHIEKSLSWGKVEITVL